MDSTAPKNSPFTCPDAAWTPLRTPQSTAPSPSLLACWSDTYWSSAASEREAQLLGDVCVFDGQGFLHLRGRQDRGSFSDALSGGAEEQTLLGWGEPSLQRHCHSQEQSREARRDPPWEPAAPAVFCFFSAKWHEGV